MEKQIKDSLYTIDEYGVVRTPRGKVANPINGNVNVVINGKKTRKNLLILMIEAFGLSDDNIQILEGNDFSLSNLVSLNLLREHYILTYR